MIKSLKAIKSYLNEAWYTLYSIAKGHIVTLKNLFRKKGNGSIPRTEIRIARRI